MSKSITYAEYRDMALKGLKDMHLPQDYINDLEKRGCIKAAYKQELKAAELLGYSVTSASSFVYGCHMLYHDLPDGDDEGDDKSTFDFKFNSVKKK